MSSILKALRKVEDEKAAIGEGGVDLAHDILRRGYDEPKRSFWPFWLLGGVCLLALIGTAWLLLSPSQVDTVQKAPASPVADSVTAGQHVIEDPQPTASTSNDEVTEVRKPESAISAEQTIAAPVQEPPVLPSMPVILLPDLRVDEIVYTASRDSRLAVVNDLPVMEGTYIEGAQVVEILPDRVRFAFEGVSFNKFPATDRGAQ